MKLPTVVLSVEPTVPEAESHAKNLVWDVIDWKDFAKHFVVLHADAIDFATFLKCGICFECFGENFCGFR